MRKISNFLTSLTMVLAISLSLTGCEDMLVFVDCEIGRYEGVSSLIPGFENCHVECNVELNNEVMPGTVVTMKAVAGEGWEFVRWVNNMRTDYEEIFTENPLTFKVKFDGDYHFVAEFRPTDTDSEEPEGPGQPEIPDAPEGAAAGLFSVGEGRQVFFARGNLQYCASTGTWKFAEEPYGKVSGEENEKIAPDFDGWIDLFSWGTSGYAPNDTRCNPTYTSSNLGSYFGPYGDYDLVGENYKYDWGSRPIANGGNQPGLWRTPSEAEYLYLFNERENAASLFGYATVSSVTGIILLADNCEVPSGIAFIPGPERFSTNIYSAEEWKRLEEVGAVFLPKHGYRVNDCFSEPNNMEFFYWTSTHSVGYMPEYGDARKLYLYDGRTPEGKRQSRFYGLPVRLVQDVGK